MKEVLMNDFRYIFEDRFAETKGYQGFSADKDELNNFFDQKVKDKLGDHGTVGVDSTKQKIYNVCYDCNIPLWNEIYQRVVNIGNSSGVTLNWDEIKHCMRFTFIWMPPGGDLIPHTANYFRALSAFNTPLRGKTEINFYEHLEQEDGHHKVGKKLETHEYFNPNFLNVNRYHGIVNNTDEERMILKSHLLIVPWHKLIEAYETDEVTNMWDFTVPWQQRAMRTHEKKHG
jgi:hypothetical protein